jgi:hypothetical protein
MATVRPCPVEAQHIARGVQQAGFAPQPALVPWFLGERVAPRLQATDSVVQVRALEVHDDLGGSMERLDPVERKRGSALGTLQAGIARQGADDQPQTQAGIELDRLFDVACGDGDLVQLHRMGIRMGWEPGAMATPF